MQSNEIASFSVRGTIPTPKNVDVLSVFETDRKLRCSWCGEKGCVGKCTLPAEAFILKGNY